MRWKKMVLGLALTLGGVAGCQQQVFLHECDYAHYNHLAIPNLENDQSASVIPVTRSVPVPASSVDPEREVRYLSLSEALAIAMENGNEGGGPFSGTLGRVTLSAQAAGRLNDGSGDVQLAQFSPLLRRDTSTTSDGLKTLGLEPAAYGANIESSLAKFDVQWTTSMSWNTTDVPTQGLSNLQEGTTATLNSSLLKPLPTGGVAGITFANTYTDLTNPPVTAFTVFNPAYTPSVQFQFEQPLLQGFGIEINQLRATHPGSILSNLNTGGRVDGILLTRVRQDMSRVELERRVHNILLVVESTYWQLYGAYWNLYSQEQALRQSYEAWKINKARFDAGRIGIQDLAQSRKQFEQFRSARLGALGGVLEKERNLRNIMGMQIEDGKRLVPSDSPTLTPYRPDWDSAVNDTLALKPDVILLRQDLKLRQMDLRVTKDLLLPDLRFTSTYNFNGLGTQLDGGGMANAFRSLATGDFSSWSLGLRLNVPIGFRDAHAQERQARLALARSYMVLQEQERRALNLLEIQYRLVLENYQHIEILRSQREAAATELEARFKQFLAGQGTLDILLESQRLWSVALSQEYDAIVAYNIALAGFEWAKGTILQYDNVAIAEGPLPECASSQAAEHARQRSKALVLRERAVPDIDTKVDFEHGNFGIVPGPDTCAPSLAGIAREPVPELKDARATKKVEQKDTRTNTVQQPTTPGSMPATLPELDSLPTSNIGVQGSK